MSIQLASENRVGTRLFQRSVGSKSTDEYLEKWVDELLEKGEWGVGMTHGISYGYDAFKNPQVFWNHLEKVKNQEDNIWVGTFREVAAYEKERDSTRLKISHSGRRIKIKPTLDLDKNLFTEHLTTVVALDSKRIKSIKQGRKNLLKSGESRYETTFDFDPFGGDILIVIKK